MSDQVKIGVGVTGAHKVEDDFRRINAQLEKTAALLSKISGRSLSGVDAGMAEHTFSGLRRVSSGLRGYSGLNDFIDSPAATLRDATARGRAYRDRVIQSILGAHVDAAEREHGAGFRVTHPRGGFFAGAVNAAAKQSGLGKFGDFAKAMRGGGAAEEGGGLGGAFKGGMAGGAGAMVGAMVVEKAFGLMKQFVGPIKEEATAIDNLKRRTGDLGMGFSRLMDQAHKAADGLGVTYAESAKLANAMARTAGNFKGGDLRSAIGFARASGMDIGASVDFFGTMRRIGDIGSGEGQMKRFAYLVGEAVSASGYSGQVEAITRAVAQYATTSARFGLSSPNFGGYLGALTGLTRSGIPGLDPEGAAALLGRADAAIRAGGGGQWGQAFLMQALGGGIGDPYAVRALFQQGIFGTGAQAFSGPWADMVKGFGGRVPIGTGATNFSRIKSAFDRIFAGTGSAAPAAFAQLFGLQSDAQGAALHQMSPVGFDNLMHSLQRYGVRISNVSATGMMDFGAVNQARGVSALLGVRDKMLARGDLSSGDRSFLSGLGGGMGERGLRAALGKFALTREQEDTPTTVLRRWATDTENTFAGLGDRLLGPLNGILTAVNKLAGLDAIMGSGYLSSGNAPHMTIPTDSLPSAFSRVLAAHESSGDPLARAKGSSATGLFQFTSAAWQQYGAGGNIYSISDQLAALGREMAYFRSLGATTPEQMFMGHRYGAKHLFDPPTAQARAESAEYRAEVTVNINHAGGTTSVTVPLVKAGAPIMPAGMQ
jgi:hypothetical protein